jgi:tRNA threonylcarbamoyladenosine biosynthesis protein TsaE
VYLADEAATLALGARLGALLPAGAVVYLRGDLGCGKTTLVRGLLQAQGWQGKVRSPTYTLMESYHLATRHYLHLDLYRLASPDELEYLGLRDWLALVPVWLIEWPERGTGWLPAADLQLTLSYAATARQAEFTAQTALGRPIIAKLLQV